MRDMLFELTKARKQKIFMDNEFIDLLFIIVNTLAPPPTIPLNHRNNFTTNRLSPKVIQPIDYIPFATWEE